MDTQIGWLMVMLKQQRFVHEVMQHLICHAGWMQQLQKASEPSCTK